MCSGSGKSANFLGETDGGTRHCLADLTPFRHFTRIRVKRLAYGIGYEGSPCPVGSTFRKFATEHEAEAGSSPGGFNDRKPAQRASVLCPF